MHSQFGEDAILNALLDRIGDGTKIVTDIGARLAGSNSANLIKNRGYSATLIDVDTTAVSDLRKHFPEQRILQREATIDNVNSLVDPFSHVLSIDIDSYDFWLWAAIDVKPKVVIVEINNMDAYWVAPSFHIRKDSRGSGASLKAMDLLARNKGYTRHARTEANAIYVRN